MENINKFYNEVMDIIDSMKDNEFIDENAANILRQNITEAKDDIIKEL